METSKAAEVLLKALETAGGGRARIELDLIRSAFLQAFPQWQGSADRRERLRMLVDELAAARRVRLPHNRRRGWEQAPTPSLPRWLIISRKIARADASFDHRTFPWVAELAFIAGLRAVANPNELRQIHDFLKDHPEQRPIVPVKERSFQLFGDEKRLDTLRKNRLFGSNRLTLELLRCRDVPASLPCMPGPLSSSSTWLIVENEATFHSFSRLNQLKALHVGILLGSGRNVLRAVDFLAGLIASSTHRDVLYFGDIDRGGIEIPVILDRRLYKHTGHHVLPASEYYEWLLTFAAGDGISSPQVEESTAVEWLPPHLRRRVQTALARAQPIAQEAIGWEFLSKQFGIAEDVDSF